jgi:hypothetical protein
MANNSAFANKLKKSPPMKKKASKQSPQPTFLQLTTPTVPTVPSANNLYVHPYLVKNLHNIKRSTQSMERTKGGFGSLDPLLAAAFLAGVRMSMNQKDKAKSVASNNKQTKSKKSKRSNK